MRCFFVSLGLCAAAAAVAPSALECGARRFALDRAAQLAPREAKRAFDALQLADCGDEKTGTQSAAGGPDSDSAASAVYVDGVFGDNGGDGRTAETAVRTVAEALRRAAPEVRLCAGTHFLAETLVVSSAVRFFGAPLDANGRPTSWLSGGVLLQNLDWKPSNVGSGVFSNVGSGVFETTVKTEFEITGLFTHEPHRRLTRARFPNGNAETTLWGYTSPRRLDFALPLSAVIEWIKPPVGKRPETRAYLDLSKDSASRPTKQDSKMVEYNSYGSGSGGVCDLWRSSKRRGSYWCSNVTAGGWAEVDRLMSSDGIRLLPNAVLVNATAVPNAKLWRPGLIVHAWHPQSWFVNMFRVSKVAVRGSTVLLEFGDAALPDGGWQGGRTWCTCGGRGECDWYVENALSELDAEDEFFHDLNRNVLYARPNSTLGPLGDVIAPKLETLVRIVADDVAFARVGFRDSKKTFLAKDWAAPSGGDWALFDGAAVEVREASRTNFSKCVFSRLDGSALLLAGRAYNTCIVNTTLEYIGDNGVGLWGETDEWDGRSGSQPRDTMVDGLVCHDVGLYEKQSSCLFQAKACLTTIKRSLMYNLPRAAINFNDGFGGGNVVEDCLIFNTCRESGDHGAINTWDRMPFLSGLTDNFSAKQTKIRRNLIFANSGASQGVDNDDGSSFYEIEDNVFYSADGFKMDYGGHDSKFDRNLVVTFAYDDANCFNVGDFVPGHGDAFRNNTCVVIGEPAADEDRIGSASSCDSAQLELSGNSYFTLHGNASLRCGGRTLLLEDVQRDFGNEMQSSRGTLPDDAELLRLMRSWLP
ncbi:hypothetical protein M885DRAFT_572143 [Pelagophyceae sp. CCMP2097]|nr:hypothetical protein M885DRAFT_572143 [Pelagophyceae sp. CCMP2097]